MSTFEIFLVSLIQGLTEFLPVSSSGHLRIAEYFFGLKEPATLFDVSLHAGTLVAVILYLRKEIIELLRGLFKKKPDKSALRLAGMIIAASVPTAIIGYCGGDFSERNLASLNFIGIFLVINSIILLLPFLFWKGGNSRKEASLYDISLFQSIMVGIAQGIGILRGISRSGITISAGITSRIAPDAAARFSFLVSIPAIMGALFLEVARGDGNIGKFFWGDYFFGATIAFISGLFALKLLFSVVRRGSLHLFAPYCAVVGILLLIFGS